MIWLNIDEAFTYLMEHRSVYLLRENETAEGRHVLMSRLKGRPYQVGIVYVELVAELVPYIVRCEIDHDGHEVGPCQEGDNYNEALEPLAPKSGFKNSSDWVDALRPYHHVKHYFYHVYLIQCYTKSPQPNAKVKKIEV